MVAKYTEEQTEAAYQKRKAINNVKLFKRRQEVLKQRSLTESNIVVCICGKYFDENVYSENYPDAKRKNCVKCPLAPKFRERKVWNNRMGKWETKQVPR